MGGAHIWGPWPRESHLKVQHEYFVPHTHRHHSIVRTKPQTQQPPQEGAEDSPRGSRPAGSLVIGVGLPRPLGNSHDDLWEIPTAKSSAIELCAEEREVWSDFGSSRELKTLESSSGNTWNPGTGHREVTPHQEG